MGGCGRGGGDVLQKKAAYRTEPWKFILESKALDGSWEGSQPTNEKKERQKIRNSQLSLTVD